MSRRSSLHSINLLRTLIVVRAPPGAAPVDTPFHALMKYLYKPFNIPYFKGELPWL